MKHFVSIVEHSTDTLRHALDVARRLKQQLKTTRRNDPIFAGKTAALIFEKPSLRTRVSFTQAMNQCGGQAITLTNEEIGLGKREPVKDVARVLSGMCDAIVARTFEHAKVLELAQFATVPVINALTDYSHPCQAMADLLTVEEHFGRLSGLTMAYVGDGNNVARSLAVACGKFGVRFVCCTPDGYALPGDDLERLKAQVPGMDYVATIDPRDAVREADVLYTDTWVSMGQETEKQQRLNDFAGFQINADLLGVAPKHAIVLHCLPAYRGLEITDEVMEGPQSRVFQEAENRLHAQKGLLAVLLGKA
ncbi:MAG TPA: ornithine carbamoyltransferase [Tepidisphaeraceae bacterium]|jgi:ornithine carbamoyltransferase